MSTEVVVCFLSGMIFLLAVWIGAPENLDFLGGLLITNLCVGPLVFGLGAFLD